jgi:hypothetical protein
MSSWFLHLDVAVEAEKPKEDTVVGAGKAYVNKTHWSIAYGECKFLFLSHSEHLYEIKHERDTGCYLGHT